MKHLWLMCAAAAIFSAQRPQPVPPVKDMTAEQEEKWAAETEALVDKACASCHPIADITRARKTWADWNLTVGRMAQLGIEADEDHLTAMKLYLTRY